MAKAATAAVVEIPLREKLGAVTPAESIEHLSLLIYGEPGAGKTFLAGTAQDHPDTSPVIIFDIEGGVTTLRRRRDIDVIQIRSIKELEQKYNELAADTSGYYKTVVVDSLTELQKLDMRDIMEEQYQKRPDTTDKDVPSQREWGKSGEHIRKIVRAFRDLPMNSIFTALSTIDKDEAGIVTYFPDLPGKLRIHIPGFVSIVGYLTANEEKGEILRRLQVAKTRRVIAKDRTDSLGDIIESPTIPLMWERIQSD